MTTKSLKSSIFKGALIALVTFFLLFVVSIFLMVRIVNPATLQNQINQLIQKNTGREFVITGDMKWSFFPWLGVTLRQLSLSNAPGFNQDAFAKIQEADINIRVLPLFFGKMQIGTITLKNATFNLMVDSKGNNNWNDLLSKKSHQDSSSELKNTDDQKVKGKFDLQNLAVSHVDINNAIVNWDNNQSQQHMTFQVKNLDIKDINFNKSFPIRLKMNVSDRQSSQQINLDLSTVVQFSIPEQKYTFQKFNLEGDLINKKYPNGQVPFTLRTDADFDLNQQIASLKNIKLNLGNVAMNGNLNGTKIMQSPVFQGNVNVPDFDLHQLFDELGATYHPTDPKALRNFSLQSNVLFSPKFIKLSDLNAQLDKTKIQGKFNFANFNNKNFDFDFQINEIDLNRYLSASSVDDGKHLPNAQKANPVSADNKIIPTQIFNQLSGQGSIKINLLNYNDIQAKNLNAQIAAKNGVIRISPIQATLFEAPAQINLILNAQNTIPQLFIQGTLSQVQMSNLLKQINKTSKLTLSGLGDLKFNFHTQGNTSQSMVKNLNGNLNFMIKNGMIKNLDIGQQIFAALQHVLKSNVNNSTSTQTTHFDTLSGTIQIKNGIASNDDLSLKGQAIEVTGTGIADLNTQNIDYSLKAVAMGSPFGKDIMDFQQRIGGSIPIKITGTFSDPKVTPDYAALAKNLLKEKVIDEVQKHVDDQVGQVLEGIKGILGK